MDFHNQVLTKAHKPPPTTTTTTTTTTKYLCNDADTGMVVTGIFRPPYSEVK